MTPFDTSHIRRARRICSDSGTPSRSLNDSMAAKMSSSGRNVTTLELGVMYVFFVIQLVSSRQFVYFLIHSGPLRNRSLRLDALVSAEEIATLRNRDVVSFRCFLHALSHAHI